MEPFKMHIVEIYGPPRQRGRIHGETLRAQIQGIFDLGRQGLELAGGPSLEMIASAFIQSTGHLNAASRWTPDLVDEIKGIAEGAAVDFGVLWAFQCQDESYWFTTGQLGLFPRSVEQHADPDRCSSLGLPAREKRPVLLAQNLDTPTLYNGNQTLLHIHDPSSERQAYVVTEPGLVGICGLNNTPLGVCQNTLAMKLNYDPDGLPAMLVARGLIEQPDLASARRFLHTIRHASGINYMVANTETVEDYECSGTQVSRFFSSSDGGWLVHTNHPLVSSDRQDPGRFSDDTRLLYERSNQHSFCRLDSLTHNLAAPDEADAVASIRRALSSHDSDEFPVCRHRLEGADPMLGMTNNSLIMVLSCPPVLHLTSGPPCRSENKTFQF